MNVYVIPPVATLVSLSSSVRQPLANLKAGMKSKMEQAEFLKEMANQVAYDRQFDPQREETLQQMHMQMREAEKHDMGEAEVIAQNISYFKIPLIGKEAIASILSEQINKLNLSINKPYADFYEELSKHHEELENILFMFWENPHIFHQVKLSIEDMNRLQELFQTIQNSRDINPDELNFSPQAKETLSMLRNYRPIIRDLIDSLDYLTGNAFGRGFTILVI
ncbi:MAG: hypothetical protein HYR97_08315 [Candidatus Melainabacteria bacterium]|nr:hypothetical protein [Candidatus Melainabacteria bacterium]MBI3308764.1 hypothetical protein [Candidatus Melainabacteria bacterium]